MVSAYSLTILALYLVSNSAALPIRRAIQIREVPQEHSHERILRAANVALKLNNPDNIQDAVFGLLGNAAAAAGAGKITELSALQDLDCLQTATADRAFTNAKAAGDVAGMTAALQYRALERNTGKIGLESVQCTSFTPTNPEIAAVTQHQDPAAQGAATKNKAIVLALAKQIASIGGNPQDALETGTFQPGDLNDATAKGNTCDDANDAQGCIISRNLIVLDATADEITAAVGDANTGTDCTAVPVTITVTAGSESTPTSAPTTSIPAQAPGSTQDPAPVQTQAPQTSSSAAASTSQTKGPGSSSSTVTPASTTAPAPAPAPTTSRLRPKLKLHLQQRRLLLLPLSNGGNNGNNGGDSGNGGDNGGNNLQVFSQSLGGVVAPKVTASGNQFQVEGNSLFNDLRNALARSCDVQNNQCANASNAAGQSKTFSVAECNAQQQQCLAQANAAASK
ncbi:hypothetical protein RhiXN_01603 [Rhizoctonia solani]|uniref:Uncharacterized protein n=1 Tax=Rhizoctonia solani TaxID=456999 RepID=A0A8H8PB28_9AGAM|nr:uncharacterized protein RhiXN_01603 [Rhizoctonia solani]QRW27008.1 hypothetical protein RhiXN_01603 [Rhizoctonia solani]